MLDNLLFTLLLYYSEVKMIKLKTILLVLSMLYLSGCSLFKPCTTTLTINNGSNDSDVILINRDNNFFEYIVIKNGKQFFDNDIMDDIRYVFINDSNIEGIFELRETDHSFSTKHQIVFNIENEQFIIDENGKSIIFFTNYEPEMYSNFGVFENFEDFIKYKYEDIYFIIKN